MSNTIEPTAYNDALTEARRVGASQASDKGVMALFCENTIQILCGAVSPKLVWEGAQAAGLTAKDLARLAGTDAAAVDNLQWVA